MNDQDLSPTHSEMLLKLRSYGQDHGFAALGTAVVVVGPGAPFSVNATWFAAAELDKAVQAGVLRRVKLTGSFEIDRYLEA
jgi:hypothetical protein